MLKLSLASYDWALRHLIAEGDTDLFPSPFEISALRHSWPTIRKQLADTDVTNYAWRGGRRFVVPKKMLAFRVATQLDPLDSLILAALMYKYGPALEAHRIPISERRVFSHRLGRSGDGRLYADRPSWHDFWETSVEKAKSSKCSFVVVADIADFYNQVYHHVIERQLQAALPKPAAKTLKRFLQTLTDKGSRGIPVGPHSSHILAECALDPTDRSLLSHGYDFCRYVDDIHIFCSDEEEATGALYDLVQILDNQQRLMIQNEKTWVRKAQEFIELANSMLIDRPATDEEAEILTLISDETGGDPYREISLQDLEAEDLDLLSQKILEQLLGHYLEQEERVDYPRLSWLMRRLTQVGAPGGLDFILSNIARLSPILGPVSRYIMAAVPNYNGDKNLIGAKILRALEYPIIKKSHYLQAILLDVIATLPELDHVDLVTARYGGSDPLVRREILRAAAIGARGDWLRDRKTEFRSMDPWLRRAFVSSSAALPEEEAHFWLQAVRDNLSPLEKVVASFAHKRKDLKLGEINITKL